MQAVIRSSMPRKVKPESGDELKWKVGRATTAKTGTKSVLRPLLLR